MMARALSDQLAPHTQVAFASSASIADADDNAPEAPAVSSGVFPADLHGLRRCFPDRWAAFLRAHVQSATHVAAFFDVDHHTARAWLKGKHGANGPVVLFALQRVPGAVEMLLEAAA